VSPYGRRNLKLDIRDGLTSRGAVALAAGRYPGRRPTINRGPGGGGVTDSQKVADMIADPEPSGVLSLSQRREGEGIMVSRRTVLSLLASAGVVATTGVLWPSKSTTRMGMLCLAAS
jgi:hypothetical protein